MYHSTLIKTIKKNKMNQIKQFTLFFFNVFIKNNYYCKILLLHLTKVIHKFFHADAQWNYIFKRRR